jgi:hypothetical protein
MSDWVPGGLIPKWPFFVAAGLLAAGVVIGWAVTR